jgi:hypothetical protein
MKNNFNVFGDVVGNELTLKALLAKMPQDAEALCLGDPNDRGPRSKQVIEFLMQNGRTVFSNHTHMFTEEWKQSAMPGAYPRYYDSNIFFGNGGEYTMKSYADSPVWRAKENFFNWIKRVYNFNFGENYG